MFSAFILFDLLRTVVLQITFLAGGQRAGATNAYGLAYKLSTPLDIILLGLAGLEAGSTLAPAAGRLYPIAVFGTLLACVAYVPVPIVNAKPLLGLFIARAVISGGVFAATLALTVWTQRITAHAAVLSAFCSFDAVEYWAVALNLPRVDLSDRLAVQQRDLLATTVGMAGALACLIAWCALSVHGSRRSV